MYVSRYFRIDSVPWQQAAAGAGEALGGGQGVGAGEVAGAVSVAEGPAAEDLLWEHAGVRPWERAARSVVCHVGVLVMLVLSAAAVARVHRARAALGVAGDVAAALAVVGGNVVLRWGVGRAGGFKKKLLVSAQEASVARAVALALTANSVGIPVLLGADAGACRYAVARVLRGVLEHVWGLRGRELEAQVDAARAALPLGAGAHRDLTPDWYASVGVGLVGVALGNLVMLSLAPVVAGGVVRGVRAWWFRASMSTRVHTTRQAGALLQAPAFDLAGRYGVLLAWMGSTLVLAPAMPVLWLVGAVALWAAYVVDKVVLLRRSRAPAASTRALSDACLGYLKYPAILHMAVAVWAFSAGNANPLAPAFPRSGSVLAPTACVPAPAAPAQCAALPGCHWSPSSASAEHHRGGPGASAAGGGAGVIGAGACRQDPGSAGYVVDIGPRVSNPVTAPTTAATIVLLGCLLVLRSPWGAQLSAAAAAALARVPGAASCLVLFAGNAGSAGELLPSYAHAVRTRRFGAGAADYDPSQVSP